MLSVVVPVYNGEKYIRDCIESIVSQDYQQWELLLVNDGSTDNSLDICKEYACRDKRVLVIDKLHGGVSDTRNTGIKRAMGDYILFADADDYFVQGAFGKIAAKLEQDGYPDVLAWSFEVRGPRNDFDDYQTLKSLGNHCEPLDLLHRLISIDDNKRFRGFVWRCAFKRSMIDRHQVSFIKELRMSEDFKFIVDALTHSESVTILAERLYVYRLNPDSVTAKYKAHVHDNMSWINQWMVETLCSEHPSLMEGAMCCCAETYIVAIQNMCFEGTPYGLWSRIVQTRKLRRRYHYAEAIAATIRRWGKLSTKRKIVFLSLYLNLEPIYIFWFTLKRQLRSS